MFFAVFHRQGDPLTKVVARWTAQGACEDPVHTALYHVDTSMHFQTTGFNFRGCPTFFTLALFFSRNEPAPSLMYRRALGHHELFIALFIFLGTSVPCLCCGRACDMMQPYSWFPPLKLGPWDHFGVTKRFGV